MQPSASSEAPEQAPAPPHGPDVDSSPAPRHSPESGAASRNSEQPAALNKTVEQAIDQLAEMAALGGAVKEAYVEQLTLAGKVAVAEWQLTGRSLIIAAALVACLGVGMILLWGSILLLLGYLLFQLSHSVLIAVSVLVLLQIILLLWCCRSLGYVLSQMGFSHTLRQLRQLFSSPTQENQHANSTTPQETAARTGAVD